MTDIKTKLKYGYVDPLTGVAIVCTTVLLIFGVGIGGLLLGSEYESSCSAKPGEEPVCLKRYAYKGAGNLDISMPSLQTCALAIGAGIATYRAIKAGKVPEELKNIIGSGEEASP